MLDIAPSGGADLNLERVSAALRKRGVAAVVGEEDGTVTARVALTTGGDLVVESGDSLTATAPQPVLDALARDWSADVLLEAGDLFLVGRGRGAADEAPVTAPVQDHPVRVHVVRGDHAGSRAALPQQLEASVTVVEAEGALIVMPHGHSRDAWPPAQRPVVTISRTRTSVVVEVFSAAGLAAFPDAERMRGRGIPDLTLSWPARWFPVLPEVGTAGEVQRMLCQAALERIPELPDEGPVLEELRLTRPELDRLRSLQNDGALAGHIVRTFHLPGVVDDIVLRRVDVDALPGARRIERTEWGRRAWELTARPSLWSRLFRRGGNDEGPGDRGRAGPS
ncbi:hypothetical protein ACIGEP_10660 [Microbacterium sp. NPDC077663]|uniref:hypothetical protein n=1 Tax=Microbacterium sp. NPDC077663 TaxID=3364189 RepID=UPI0037CCB98E